MGCDPTAILYYGIKLDDEPKHADEDDEDCSYHEINDEWKKDNEPSRPKDPVAGTYSGQAWDAWREELAKYQSSPLHVEIDWSGTDNCHDDGWYVHCRGMDLTADWDSHLEINGTKLAQDYPDADDALKRFCDQFSLAYKQPAWHLAVRYF